MTPVPLDHTNLYEGAGLIGPMNIVIESSCTKWRTGKRSAWSIAASETPCR